MKCICFFLAILIYIGSFAGKSFLGNFYFKFKETERLTKMFNNYVLAFNQVKKKITLLEVKLIELEPKYQS